MQTNKRTLEIKILTESDAQKAASTQFLDAWENEEYSGEYLTFTSPASFFEVINARRWELVVKLQSLGKTSIRSLAKQVESDVRRVHDDVKILMTHGVIEQDDNSACVSYETIHADFKLSKVA